MIESVEPDEEGVHERAQEGTRRRVKNYITPSGLQRLKDEHRFLLTRERPAVTQVVAWAASNGDRSENADYQYGKRRLREIDRRIRFLTKRIDAAEVVDPEAPRGGRAATQVFFGATVRYANAAGTERVVSVVGLDEVDLDRNHISWMSPLARALMKSGAGDRVVLHAPGGTEQLQILEVRYRAHPRGALQRTTWGRVRAEASSSALESAQAAAMIIVRPYTHGTDPRSRLHRRPVRARPVR